MTVDKNSVFFMKDYLRHVLEFEKYVYIWSHAMEDANACMKQLYEKKNHWEQKQEAAKQRLSALKPVDDQKRIQKEHEAEQYTSTLTLFFLSAYTQKESIFERYAMYFGHRKVSPFLALLRRPPHAWATLIGGDRYPMLRGLVRFYQTPDGVLVSAEVQGLPSSADPCESPIFGFHIHEGTRCEGTPDDPFFATGGHFNPHRCPHPYHAGDLPPLFGVNGRAFSAHLTDRFALREIIGKTIILHSAPDDFTTQPSGNAGEKIACGIIMTSRNILS